MKKILGLLLIISTQSYAQNDFNAMILSFDGEGILTRDGKNHRMELPQSYLPGDVLSVKSGNATILLFTGKEVPLTAVSYYTVPADDSTPSNALSSMANTSENRNLLAQTGAAYQIRGNSNVFPMRSKAIDKENITLRFQFENNDSLNLHLKVINSLTQQVVFEDKNLSDSLVSLSSVNFETGKSYYWTLSNTPSGKPEMGAIIMSGEASHQVPDVLPASHFKTLNVISELYNNKFYFEAYVLIENCIQSYPDYQIYKKLMLNLLAE